jgi:hypothetical protein
LKTDRFILSLERMKKILLEKWGFKHMRAVTIELLLSALDTGHPGVGRITSKQYRGWGGEVEGKKTNKEEEWRQGCGVDKDVCARERGSPTLANAFSPPTMNS